MQCYDMLCCAVVRYDAISSRRTERGAPRGGYSPAFKPRGPPTNRPMTEDRVRTRLEQDGETRGREFNQ